MLDVHQPRHHGATQTHIFSVPAVVLPYRKTVTRALEQPRLVAGAVQVVQYDRPCPGPEIRRTISFPILYRSVVTEQPAGQVGLLPAPIVVADGAPVAVMEDL